MKANKNAILSILLCFVMAVSLTACAGRPEPAPGESSISVSEEGSSGDGKSFINTLELPEGPYVRFTLPKLTQQIAEKHDLNSDTVGWLKVPNTTIDDVVLWYPGDRNAFYYRRNFEKEYSFNGVYYADYRCTFNRGVDNISPNTVIYGHSMSDDPLDKRKLFSPLKFYLDPAFAEDNPYIFFSVDDSDMVWEVFAVFYSTINLPYNNPNPEDFAGIVSECTKRSLYTYETQVSASDKILTLSTCTYSLPDGTGLSYPNDYRYVIMAKLVTDTSNLKEKAVFEINESPKAP